jgi:hypothetical protein
LIARWRYRLGRLARLPRRERRELWAAQWALVIARARRRWSGTGRLVTFVADSPAGAPAASDDQGGVAARRLALAVERAAEHGVLRTTCLERAVALDLLLRRRGIAGGRITVGVRWRDDRFVAHAWLELADRVLLDLPERVAGFTPIVRAEAPHS